MATGNFLRCFSNYYLSDEVIVVDTIDTVGFILQFSFFLIFSSRVYLYFLTFFELLFFDDRRLVAASDVRWQSLQP